MKGAGLLLMIAGFVTFIVEPELMNLGKPAAWQVSRETGRIVACVGLAFLALMIAFHFHQFLKSFSE